MTAGKTIALTKRTFVGKVISLLFNMLSSLVITFLPRSKHLLISFFRVCQTLATAAAQDSISAEANALGKLQFAVDTFCVCNLYSVGCSIVDRRLQDCRWVKLV